MVSKEELLKQRKRVEIYYPFSPFQIGDILTVSNSGKRWRTEKGNWIGTEELEKCPQIFKKLEWWEEREESDLPEYVRLNDKIYKITRWVNYFGWRPETTRGETSNLSVDWHFNRGDALPSTEEEFRNGNR